MRLNFLNLSLLALVVRLVISTSTVTGSALFLKQEISILDVDGKFHNVDNPVWCFVFSSITVNGPEEASILISMVSSIAKDNERIDSRLYETVVKAYQDYGSQLSRRDHKRFSTIQNKFGNANYQQGFITHVCNKYNYLYDQVNIGSRKLGSFLYTTFVRFWSEQTGPLRVRTLYIC